MRSPGWMMAWDKETTWSSRQSAAGEDPWCDWDHPDLMLNWGEPRLWDLGVYIRKRRMCPPCLLESTCKQPAASWPSWCSCFGCGENYATQFCPRWNQRCIFILIGNWKGLQSHQRWSWWFIVRCGEALFPLSGSLIPGDWTLIKFLMKLSAVEVRKKQKEKRGLLQWSYRSKFRRRQYVNTIVASWTEYLGP